MQTKTSKCRAPSCSAEVVWVRTTNGNLMPLDPKPTDDGNIILFPKTDGPVAYVVGPADLLGEAYAGLPRYVSHFASCPDAESFRRRGEL